MICECRPKFWVGLVCFWMNYCEFRGWDFPYSTFSDLFLGSFKEGQFYNPSRGLLKVGGKVQYCHHLSMSSKLNNLRNLNSNVECELPMYFSNFYWKIWDQRLFGNKSKSKFAAESPTRLRVMMYWHLIQMNLRSNSHFHKVYCSCSEDTAITMWLWCGNIRRWVS